MKLITALLSIALLSGCAGLDKAVTGSGSVPSNAEREKIVGQFPELTKEQQSKFVAGEPWIGMSQSQLKAMWNNDPKKTKKILTSAGNVDVQLYELRVGDWTTGIKSKYYKVTMLNSKVSEVQELDSGDLATF